MKKLFFLLFLFTKGYCSYSADTTSKNLSSNSIQTSIKDSIINSVQHSLIQQGKNTALNLLVPTLEFGGILTTVKMTKKGINKTGNAIALIPGVALLQKHLPDLAATAGIFGVWKTYQWLSTRDQTINRIDSTTKDTLTKLKTVEQDVKDVQATVKNIEKKLQDLAEIRKQLTQLEKTTTQGFADQIAQTAELKKTFDKNAQDIKDRLDKQDELAKNNQKELKEKFDEQKINLQKEFETQQINFKIAFEKHKEDLEKLLNAKLETFETKIGELNHKLNQLEKLDEMGVNISEIKTDTKNIQDELSKTKEAIEKHKDFFPQNTATLEKIQELTLEIKAIQETLTEKTRGETANIDWLKNILNGRAEGTQILNETSGAVGGFLFKTLLQPLINIFREREEKLNAKIAQLEQQLRARSASQEQ